MKEKIKHYLGIAYSTGVVFFFIYLCWHYFHVKEILNWYDTGWVLGIMFWVLVYASYMRHHLQKRPLYDQLGWEDRTQVREEYWDSLQDANTRRGEETKARERTHKEKEKRDAQEAIRLLYEHMPERIRTKSIILRHELQELGEYNDQDLAGTEDLTAVRAPIPGFSSKEASLLYSMSDKIADAVIDLALQNHATETDEPELQVDTSALFEYRYQLRREIRQDARAHLTDLDRYYYTPATPMWRAEDFKRYGSSEED